MIDGKPTKRRGVDQLSLLHLECFVSLMYHPPNVDWLFAVFAITACPIAVNLRI